MGAGYVPQMMNRLFDRWQLRHFIGRKHSRGCTHNQETHPNDQCKNTKKKEEPRPRPTLCEDITQQTDEYSVYGPPEVLRHGEKF
jgi:hypothetical protein